MVESLDVARFVERSLVAAAEHFQELTSTNDYAKELARRLDLPMPYLVVAEHQTAGRGRGANRWWTGPGSLAFSVICEIRSFAAAEFAEQSRQVPADDSAASSPGRAANHEESRARPVHSPVPALAAGIAVCDAVRPLIPTGLPLGICWPNDVYVGTRKLSGTLAETVANGRCVVGIGVNVNNRSSDAPAELRDHVVSLIDLVGSPLDRGDLLEGILRGLRKLFTQAAGPIAARADALCLQKGRTLEIALGDRILSGLCRGIDPWGRLVLDSEGGTVQCTSGIVRRHSAKQ
ncbi:MAG: biotin--[acetyl-CoA-carboxylase] ligase [Thermogutta sp.]|nr:biotin--[acetyl-CoA-carboxylase] ligase [Thermogutta sp.]